MADSLPAEVKSFVSNFEGPYIGFTAVSWRLLVSLSVEVPNMRDRAKEVLPLTRNHVEGFHHGVQLNLEACLHSIWHFVNIIRREQSIIDVIMKEIQGGQAAAPQRGKYRAITESCHGGC